MIEEFRVLEESDWERVSTIYKLGIDTELATFETNVPEWETWKENHDLASSLVLCHDSEVVGWGSISPVSKRAVYKGVGEVSIYLHPSVQGIGLGKKLGMALVETSERNGYWTLQAGIFPENKPSIYLHQSLGFRQVGIRERVGKLHNRWRDVVLMERRSRVVGRD